MVLDLEEMIEDLNRIPPSRVNVNLGEADLWTVCMSTSELPDSRLWQDLLFHRIMSSTSFPLLIIVRNSRYLLGEHDRVWESYSPLNTTDASLEHPPI